MALLKKLDAPGHGNIAGIERELSVSAAGRRGAPDGRWLRSGCVVAVATWNVLHRVHAENWGEDVAVRWPEEPERIAAVTARLAGRAEQVIALQEVSGDQLASLRAGLADRSVHAFRYPRVPAPRRGACPLRDPGEYLVLLVDGPGQEVAAGSFEGAPGKGALAVRAAGALFVATHVSGDQRRTRQLARLAGLATAWPGHPTVLLGAFNADRAAVASGPGADFSVAGLPPNALPTRPGTSGARPLCIDHVAVQGACTSSAAVEGADGLGPQSRPREHHRVNSPPAT
jgi:endonuclease/exonuclease/phosphatase family metal-dependent hydrolase